MYKNPRRITEQFNWVALVKEAITRRQEEGLNQKKHAALAGVSIPTMISFEKAEKTISIEKVLAILDVVNMVEKSQFLSNNKLDNFALQANAKWFELTKNLGQDSLSAKHPFGYVSYSFRIIGSLKKIDNTHFRKILNKVAATKYSGWSPFWIPTTTAIEPYVTDNEIIECWLGKKYERSLTATASTTDFWWASKEGYMYLQRGYEEDSNEDSLQPNEIFDIFIPVRLAAEVICYANRLANEMIHHDVKSSIELQVRYTGLQGRVLANWSDPMNPLYDRKRISNSNIANMSVTFSLDEIYEPLHESVTKIVYLLLKELYAKFSFYDLQYEFIETKLKRLFSQK